VLGQGDVADLFEPNDNNFFNFFHYLGSRVCVIGKNL